MLFNYRQLFERKETFVMGCYLVVIYIVFIVKKLKQPHEHFTIYGFALLFALLSRQFRLTAV